MSSNHNNGVLDNQGLQQRPFVTADNGGEEMIDLGEYLGILLAYKWLIALITLIGVTVGVAYALIATPIYQSNALIQVEDPQGSGLGSLEDVAGLLGGDAAIEAEIQLLKSRLVVREAVEQLGLNIVAEPAYFPIVGRAIARYFSRQQPGVAKPWLNQPQYAWGGEKIVVELLALPPSLIGKDLTLVAGLAGQYQLLDEDQQPLLSGNVGQLAERTFSNDSELKLYVAGLTARAGTRFHLAQLSPITAIEQVLENFSVSERGKKSGMLGLTLSGPNPQLSSRLLNTIADVYVDQNISRSSAEAELSLSFLEKQLPPLKERVDAAENAYNQYRTQHSSLDLNAETKSVLAGQVQISNAVLDLQQERDGLRQRFKAAHPVIQALDGKIELLRQQLDKLDGQAEALPETQQDILRLARDVEVNTGLYTKLLNIAQELRVVKAGTVGNVRIVDYALVPEKPLKPKKSLIVAMALVASLFMGVILAFLLSALRGGVNDPDELERKLGLPVYASIMHSKIQQTLMKQAKRGSQAIGILARQKPDDPAVESFRSLRTTLYFTLKQAHNNIIMVAGSSPKVGKSFTAVNLAYVLANNDKKVLLIDGDLRRGYLHRYFGKSRNHGLTEMITATDTAVGDYIHTTEKEGLYFLATGELPPNPSELLLHESFKARLEALSRTVDYIVIDGPPILAVTDAAIMGRNVATTLLVAKANHHPMRELEQASKQLQQAGVVIKGVIFNDVALNSGRYGYGKYVYQYDYKTT